MGVEPLRSERSDTVGISQQQFLAFYDTAVKPMYAYLFRATGGNRQLTEDISQDTFAVALRHARSGDAAALTVPWVITVGRNRLIDHWRRDAREERRLSELLVVPDSTMDDSDDTLLEQVRLLPPMQQAVVALHYLDGFPVADVARRLGKSCKATESLLARARQTLRTRGGVHHA
jgi:RNA polymerase sigma-70 factor (ECF subfamily)